jgi:hypothetical protein
MAKYVECWFMDLLAFLLFLRTVCSFCLLIYELDDLVFWFWVFKALSIFWILILYLLSMRWRFSLILWYVCLLIMLVVSFDVKKLNFMQFHLSILALLYWAIDFLFRI